MKNLPVHWYQGLFIRPHHLQASDRYWKELQHTSLRWDHPYCYGLLDVRHNEDSLKNGELRITKLDARMRDGTLISLDHGEEIDIDLRESLLEGPNMVYMGVPKLNPGGENVSEIGANGAHRYFRVTKAVPDETGWSSEQEVEFRRLRIELFTDRRDGYETLELGRVRRAGHDTTYPIVDQSYIPPLLAIDAWPFLRDSLVGIRSIVEEKMTKKAEALQQLEIDRIDPNDAPHFLLLDRYNECFTMLDLLIRARGVHPFLAYRELARIVSRLSILSPARQAIEILPYDHDDLGTIFGDIREKILRNLDPLVTRYLRANFVGDGTAMVVRLGPHWFDSRWQWYLGVWKGDQLSEEELHRFLDKSQEWNWVLASRDQVDEFFGIRQQGLHRTLVKRTIAELPSREKWTFYKIDPDQSVGYPRITETHTVAMRIMRHDSLSKGVDYLDHRTQAGAILRLRFALFAVAR